MSARKWRQRINCVNRIMNQRNRRDAQNITGRAGFLSVAYGGGHEAIKLKCGKLLLGS